MTVISIPGVNIAGIVCAVPKNGLDNESFTSSFSLDQINKIAQITGVLTRRIAPENLCTSDLCAKAAEKLLQDLKWESSSVDALIFISQTPDYFLPATSCTVQEKLGLSSNCAAFDINLGCSGYVYGLWLASSIIKAGLKRVLLLVGDTISKVVSPEDRSTALLFGDAGSATAIEKNENNGENTFLLGTDGKGQNNLIIPAGGFRLRPSENTRQAILYEDGNSRNEEHLYMNGGEIFNFTIQRAIPLVRDLLEKSNYKSEQVDYFVFHQANKFILKHFVKKLKLPSEKVPINIELYGNTSSASIPLVIVTNIAEDLLNSKKKVAMFGFGVGYSWGGALVDLGLLECCNLLEV